MKGVEKMKKLKSLFFAMCLLFGTVGVTEAADTPIYPWIYETFNASSLGKVTADGALLSVTVDGALKVSVGSNITNGGGGYKISTNLKESGTYKLSFLIKLEDGANIPRRGSVNNAYDEDGEIAKLYGAIREGTTLKQTLDFGEAIYWSNEEYVQIEHEFTYEYEGTDASISFRVGERSDRGGRNLQGSNNLIYFLDEVKLIPVTQTELVSNVGYTFVENETNVMRISYDFSGTVNNSLTVLMVQNGNEWETKTVLNVGENEFDFNIPADVNGKNCKIVIYPADGTAAGAIYENLIENLRLNLIQQFSMTEEKLNANIKLYYPNLKYVTVMVCQYSEENEMIDIEYQLVECNNGEEKEITLTPDIDDNMKTASMLVWEGSDLKTSEMLSLADEIIVQKE